MKTARISIAVIFVLLVSFACAATGVFAQSQRKTPVPGGGSKPPAPTPKQVTVPPDSVLQSLLKASIADFIEGVENEEFTVLHENASRDFQATFTVEQLKTIFQVFIDKKTEVLPSLKNSRTTTAGFSTEPFIRTEKGYYILVLSGEFPSRPYRVQFENEYELEDGTWKLLKIRIKM